MINGILNIYKEKGYTSHDVVARLRRIAGQKKIGHTGTLDPDAEGVLPVCLGRATRICDMLTDRDKTYEAVLLLGRTTDTQDTSGTVLSECSTEGLEKEKVEASILGFLGEYDQIPPMYSALKVNGRKLYELAREGKTVERKSGGRDPQYPDPEYGAAPCPHGSYMFERNLYSDALPGYRGAAGSGRMHGEPSAHPCGTLPDRGEHPN